MRVVNSESHGHPQKHLNTGGVRTRDDRLPACRPGAHLPGRGLVQRRHVNGLGELVDGEFLVKPVARQDAAAACTFRFEVRGGEGDETVGGCDWKMR